jgi:hypothetical protein
MKRFYEKVVPVKTGCHIWRSRLNEQDKHGTLNVNGVAIPAYRIALEVKLGRPIAKGKQANHTCDVRACVNPDHLYEGTQKDNVADAIKRNRFVPPPKPTTPPPIHKGEDNNKAVMTEELVRQLREDKKSGASYVTLAKKYGISVSTVAQIVTGKTWKGV